MGTYLTRRGHAEGTDPKTERCSVGCGVGCPFLTTTSSCHELLIDGGGGVGPRPTPTVNDVDVWSYLPVPVRFVTVGLLEALLVSVSVPVYDCRSSGRKVTLSLQFLPAAKDAGQLPRVAVNTPPEVVTSLITSAPGPWLVICTVSVRLALVRCPPKENVAGIDTRGAVGGGGGVTVTPVPVSVTFDTDPGTLLLLWVMLTVAVFAPVLVGANATLTVHVLPAAMVAQPVGVAVNNAALVPVTAMLVTISGTLTVLLTVMVCGVEVVPC